MAEKTITLKLPSIEVRQWLYRIVTAAFAVLVGYQIISPDQVPMWLNLAGAILGVAASGIASIATGQQIKTDEIDPAHDRPGKHAKPEPTDTTWPTEEPEEEVELPTREAKSDDGINDAGA